MCLNMGQDGASHVGEAFKPFFLGLSSFFWAAESEKGEEFHRSSGLQGGGGEF